MRVPEPVGRMAAQKDCAILRRGSSLRHLPAGLLGTLLPLERFGAVSVLTGCVKGENNELLGTLVDPLDSAGSKALYCTQLANAT